MGRGGSLASIHFLAAQTNNNQERETSPMREKNWSPGLTGKGRERGTDKRSKQEIERECVCVCACAQNLYEYCATFVASSCMTLTSFLVCVHV